MTPDSPLLLDDPFLKEVVTCVRQRMTDPQFGVGRLAADLHMDRSQLHRKVKAVTGLNVSRLIREVRLQKAHDLLRESSLTASEIAYDVGFSSPSYFFKCFHERFGVTAGESKHHDTAKRKPARARSVKLLYSTAAVIILIIMIASAWYFMVPEEREYVLVVLPVESENNMDAMYLAEGIQEALISELGRIPSFRVWTRGSANALVTLGSVAPVEEIDYYVRGILASDTNRISLEVSLEPAREDQPPFLLGRFENDLSEIRELQSSVVSAIVQKTGVPFGESYPQHTGNLAKVNPEVYRNYLRGMYYLDKRTGDYLELGMEYLRKAVDLDPGDPLAYAGLAQGYIRLGHSASESKDVFKKAKAAAERALAIDPNFPQALSALGQVQMYYEWDWEGAGASMRLANRLNPSMAEGHYHYAWYLNLFGHRAEAMREHKLATQLDPLGVKYHAWMAWMYATYDEFELAEEELETALELDPDYVTSWWAQGLILERQGQIDEALNVYRRMAERYPSHAFVLAAASAENHRENEALKILEGLEAGSLNPWQAIGVATVYASLGNPEKAYEWLRVKPHHAFVPWSRVNFRFENISGDPGFNAMMDFMNLPPVNRTASVIY